MHPRIPELEIPKDNPFAHDKLNRGESAQLLSHFLASVATPYVLAIDAAWGQGKTVFLMMWQKLLESEGYAVHYFNAWEADYESDPLVALMAELRLFAAAKAQTKSPEDASNLKTRAAAMGKAGIRITKYALPKLVRAGTAGVLDIEALADALEEGAAEVSEKLAEGALKEYEAQRQSLRSFRQELQALAASFAGAKGLPMIVLVDEVDRCRPT
jgi:KAP family P-loop domain